MKRFFAIPAVAVVVLLAACDDQNAKPQPTTEPAPAPQQQVLTDQDLAVQADFEDEAERAITPANYKQELEAVQAEVSGT